MNRLINDLSLKTLLSFFKRFVNLRNSNNPNDKDNRMLKIGIWTSAIWIAFMIGLLIPNWRELRLNEIGDFLAGAFSPLAFGWLLIAIFQQQKEIGLQRDELVLQRREMKTTANELAKQTTILSRELNISESSLKLNFLSRMYIRESAVFFDGFKSDLNEINSLMFSALDGLPGEVKDKEKGGFNFLGGSDEHKILIKNAGDFYNSVYEISKTSFEDVREDFPKVILKLVSVFEIAVHAIEPSLNLDLRFIGVEVRLAGRIDRYLSIYNDCIDNSVTADILNAELIGKLKSIVQNVN